MSVDSRKGGVRTLKRIALNALRLTKLRADVSEHRVAMLRDKCAIELVQLPKTPWTPLRRCWCGPLDDGREYLLAGAIKVLDIDVLRGATR